jgi:hypothetical protein
MGSFKEVFTNHHAVLPVIHVEDQKQVLRNAEIAYDEGADGVFLISMKGMRHRQLAEMQRIARTEFSTWFIGVNYLDLPTVSVFKHLDRGVSGVWVDDAQIDEFAERQIEAAIIDRARDTSGWKGLYFGGVAFKYQKEVDDFALAAKIASQFMDVVTTSGDKTGKPPDPEKIMLMKKAIGQAPLGIASGISPGNVADYKENADAFLVATSILIPGTEAFDKFKIRDLVSAVRQD